MKKARYDEFQLANRHRIAFQTLILMMVLIGINGFMKKSYEWADSQVESLVLILIPGLYFIARSIWQNAYIRANEQPTMILFLSGFAMSFGLFFLSLGVFSGTFHFVEDGQFSSQIGLLMVCLMFTMIFVLLIIRKFLDRSVLEREE